MKEEFIQYLWKFGLFDKSELIADTGDKIEIIKQGEQNYDAGPDFLNAQVKIGDTIWAGNVEIHQSSSDWYRHNHHNDEAYKNVILQAVLKNDKPIFFKNGEKLPTIELKFDHKLYNNYISLIENNNTIACENEIKSLDKFIVNYWLESLMIERLWQKSLEIESTFVTTKNDWAETFYIHLAKNFGFKVNGDPFEMLARSLPLKYLAKQKDNLTQIEAMLFGQAGFLNEKEGDEYHNLLLKEYTFLKAKYNLKPLENHLWKFLRLRPENFPTIRIAQFAALIHHSSSLFSKIIEKNDINELTMYFSAEPSSYWKNHYNFGKNTSKIKERKIGKESIINFIINTVSPFLFLYGRINGNEEMKERAVILLSFLPSEKNSSITKWNSIGINANNAAQSQALLQLKKNYCDKKKCLNCQLGTRFITRIQY